MIESLPGDPTDAGPDNRTQAIAAKDYRDLMEYAIEDARTALRTYGHRTHDDRSMLREAIAKAKSMFDDADRILRGMEAPPWSR